MNPLTLVKRTQKITTKEVELGISDDASWHAKYKNSAYIFVGGIPFDLTEGDLLAVFTQYGEVVDANLVRDKGTGKSKGFAFIAYEDQRSTILAVDNFNGAKILGRIIRVDHVADYKKSEEHEEEEQKKREERGVCRAYQRGDCTRGASCKFSHDEQLGAIILKGTRPLGVLNQMQKERLISKEPRKGPGMKAIRLFLGTRRKKKIPMGDLEDRQPGYDMIYYKLGALHWQPRVVRLTFCGGY